MERADEKDTNKELSLEEAFSIVEQAVCKLESSEITLEESFQVYEQGMKLLKQCDAMIDRVEKKVQVIQENGECHEF